MQKRLFVRSPADLAMIDDLVPLAPLVAGRRSQTCPCRLSSMCQYFCGVPFAIVIPELDSKVHIRVTVQEDPSFRRLRINGVIVVKVFPSAPVWRAKERQWMTPEITDQKAS
jgi:hypothetical protein